MKFEAGKTYATRSICDYDCIFRVTVVRRTAKSVVINYHGKQSTRRVFDCDGAEAIKPFGTYSMCAIISATPKALALASGENVAA